MLRGLQACLILLAVIGAGAHLLAAETGDERVAAGKALAMARGKGNCLACHAFDDGELPGNVGPALIFMQQRFPDKAQLRAQIWDPGLRNPDTVMPPFGRHGILTEEEIDLVVEYVYSL